MQYINLQFNHCNKERKVNSGYQRKKQDGRRQQLISNRKRNTRNTCNNW